MRSDHSPINVKFIFELNIFAGDCESVDADPLADRILPADDRALNEAVAADLGALHHCGIVDALTRAHCHSRTDHHVGTQLRGGVHLSRGVNEHVSLDLGALSQTLGLFVSQRLKEELLTNKVVLRLTDVHPVAVKSKYIEIILSSHLREYFTLNRRGLQLDPVNHIHI
jgi:hypothetical protein